MYTAVCCNFYYSLNNSNTLQSQSRRTKRYARRNISITYLDICCIYASVCPHLPLPCSTRQITTTSHNAPTDQLIIGIRLDMSQRQAANSLQGIYTNQVRILQAKAHHHPDVEVIIISHREMIPHLLKDMLSSLEKLCKDNARGIDGMYG